MYKMRWLLSSSVLICSLATLCEASSSQAYSPSNKVSEYHHYGEFCAPVMALNRVFLTRSRVASRLGVQRKLRTKGGHPPRRHADRGADLRALARLLVHLPLLQVLRLQAAHHKSSE
jgi:hypothetical protein